jgi:hypothetical protein
VIIVVLIIVLPVVFVAIPDKAQHDINSSTLEVNSQDVTQPTEDSIHLRINSTAKSSSSFHPRLDAFRASFALEGKEPFIYADVPETKADASTEIIIDQNVKIANMDSFKEYNKLVIGSETFSVLFSGKTKVHQSGLKAITVDYDKKITMKGMSPPPFRTHTLLTSTMLTITIGLNKLQGMNITDLKILSGSGDGGILPDGSNMIGTVLIPNPSVMILDLGNVTMDLAIDGKSIGYALLPNMVLKPGMNSCPMQSHVEQLSVFQSVTTKYKNAILPLDIKGNSSIVNGKHLVYFEEAIKSNTIRVDLNVGPALAALHLYNVTGTS